MPIYHYGRTTDTQTNRSAVTEILGRIFIARIFTVNEAPGSSKHDEPQVGLNCHGANKRPNILLIIPVICPGRMEMKQPIFRRLASQKVGPGRWPRQRKYLPYPRKI